MLGFVRQGALVSDQAKAMSDDAGAILGDRTATVAGDQVFDVALECSLTAYDPGQSGVRRDSWHEQAKPLGVRLVRDVGWRNMLRGAADVAVPLPSERGLAKGREAP